MNLIKASVIAREASVTEFSALIDVDNEITELVRYLTSPKFHEDPTVQVADVLRRLDPIRAALVAVNDCNEQVRNALRPGSKEA